MIRNIKKDVYVTKIDLRAFYSLDRESCRNSLAPFVRFLASTVISGGITPVWGSGTPGPVRKHSML